MDGFGKFEKIGIAPGTQTAHRCFSAQSEEYQDGSRQIRVRPCNLAACRCLVAILRIVSMFKGLVGRIAAPSANFDVNKILRGCSKWIVFCCLLVGFLRHTFTYPRKCCIDLLSSFVCVFPFLSLWCQVLPWAIRPSDRHPPLPPQADSAGGGTVDRAKLLNDV